MYDFFVIVDCKTIYKKNVDSCNLKSTEILLASARYLISNSEAQGKIITLIPAYFKLYVCYKEEWFN